MKNTRFLLSAAAAVTAAAILLSGAVPGGNYVRRLTAAGSVIPLRTRA